MSVRVRPSVHVAGKKNKSRKKSKKNASSPRARAGNETPTETSRSPAVTLPSIPVQSVSLHPSLSFPRCGAVRCDAVRGVRCDQQCVRFKSSSRSDYYLEAAIPTTPPQTLAPALPVVRDNSWPPCGSVWCGGGHGWVTGRRRYWGQGRCMYARACAEIKTKGPQWLGGFYLWWCQNCEHVEQIDHDLQDISWCR